MTAATFAFDFHTFTFIKGFSFRQGQIQSAWIVHFYGLQQNFLIFLHISSYFINYVVFIKCKFIFPLLTKIWPFKRQKNLAKKCHYLTKISLILSCHFKKFPFINAKNNRLTTRF